MKEVKAYKCDIEMDNGVECGELFEEYDDLRAHQNSNYHR